MSLWADLPKCWLKQSAVVIVTGMASSRNQEAEEAATKQNGAYALILDCNDTVTEGVIPLFCITCCVHSKIVFLMSSTYLFFSISKGRED